MTDSLVAACESGDIARVRALLKGGADPDADAALVVAAGAGHRAVVKALIAAGARLEATTADGRTALHEAAARGAKETAAELVTAGADVNARTARLETPMLLAAQLAVARRVDHWELDDITPYTIVAGEMLYWPGSVAVGCSAKEERQVARDFCPPHLGYLEALDIVRALVRAHADVNAGDASGATPLHAIAATGDLRLFRELVAKGADSRAVTQTGFAVSHAAAGSGRRHFVRDGFVSDRVDWDAVDDDGFTALHYAAIAGDEACLHALPYGCRAHATAALTRARAQYEAGWTPDLVAGAHGHDAVRETLYQWRTDPGQRPAPSSAPVPRGDERRGTGEQIVHWLAQGELLADWPGVRSSRDGFTRVLFADGGEFVAMWYGADGVPDDHDLQFGPLRALSDAVGDEPVAVEVPARTAAYERARQTVLAALGDVRAAIAAVASGSPEVLPLDGSAAMWFADGIWYRLGLDGEKLLSMQPDDEPLATLVGARLCDPGWSPRPVGPALAQRTRAAAAVAHELGSLDGDLFVTVSTLGTKRTAFGVVAGKGYRLDIDGERIDGVARAPAASGLVRDSLFSAAVSGIDPPILGMTGVLGDEIARARAWLTDPAAALEWLGRGALTYAGPSWELRGIGGVFLEAGAELDAASARRRVVGNWHTVKVGPPIDDIDAPNAFGGTPLTGAADRGDGAAVRVLLRLGADPNRTGGLGRTALLLAARGGHEDSVRQLLAAGADPHPVDTKGLGAIHWAALATSNSAEVVTLLIDAGVCPDAPAATGRSPVVVACIEGATDRPAVVEALARVGADLDACGTDGVTALYACVHHGKRASLEVLLAGGATVDKARDGWTPLILAATKPDRLDIVRTLLAAGADPNHSNELGETALHNAAERGLTEICEALLSGGCNAGLRTQTDPPRTAADAASANGHHETAKLINGFTV